MPTGIIHWLAFTGGWLHTLRDAEASIVHLNLCIGFSMQFFSEKSAYVQLWEWTFPTSSIYRLGFSTADCRQKAFHVPMDLTTSLACGSNYYHSFYFLMWATIHPSTMGAMMPWRLFLYILGFFHRMLQYQYIHVDNGVSAIVISRVILHETCLTVYTVPTWSQLWSVGFSVRGTWNGWWTVVWYPLRCVNAITALRAIRHLCTAVNFHSIDCSFKLWYHGCTGKFKNHWSGWVSCLFQRSKLISNSPIQSLEFLSLFVAFDASVRSCTGGLR